MVEGKARCRKVESRSLNPRKRSCDKRKDKVSVSSNKDMDTRNQIAASGFAFRLVTESINMPPLNKAD